MMKNKLVIHLLLSSTILLVMYIIYLVGYCVDIYVYTEYSFPKIIRFILGFGIMFVIVVFNKLTYLFIKNIIYVGYLYLFNKLYNYLNQ